MVYRLKRLYNSLLDPDWVVDGHTEFKMKYQLVMALILFGLIVTVTLLIL